MTAHFSDLPFYCPEHNTGTTRPHQNDRRKRHHRPLHNQPFRRKIPQLTTILPSNWQSAGCFFHFFQSFSSLISGLKWQKCEKRLEKMPLATTIHRFRPIVLRLNVKVL